IRQNLHFGADWIKIVVDDQRYYYTSEDIAFIVKEAANAGVKVCSHSINERGTLNAINGGVASLEHAFIMSDETLQLAKDKDIWLCGTDFSKDILNVLGIPQLYRMTVHRLKRAHKIGVKMAFGSDVFAEVPGHTRGSAVLTLIDTWIEAKIPAADILRAFTVNAAKMLEINRQRGLLKERMIADIIATPENPLENIKTLKDVKFVMKEGKVYKHAK
ncbi:amidohydrolase family protein, partial [candidate division KSB1 bacterium]